MSENIPADLNGDVLRRIRGRGDSLKASRDIDFSVVFPKELSAVAFCEQVRSDGVHARYEKSDVDEDRPWDVTVTRNMVPSHGDIGAMEDLLESLASPLGGKTDGWGCLAVMDMRPE